MVLIAVSGNYDQIIASVLLDIGIGLAVCLALITIGVFISNNVAKNISEPIVKTSERLRLLSEGDVTTPFTVEAPSDETLVLEQSLYSTVETLRTYIHDIRDVLEPTAILRYPPILIIRAISLQSVPPLILYPQLSTQR